MNFYTAKRLFSAMGMTLQRHEQTFGPIELDIRRRATGPGMQQQQPQGIQQPPQGQRCRRVTRASGAA